MGCDIHTVLERKIGRKWVAVAIDCATDRNYDRFAALAGVRADNPDECPKPRGLPSDASDTAKALSADWGVDGHSHSWIEAVEAARIWGETEHNPNDYAAKYPAEFFFGIDEGNREQMRIVYWFDN